MTHAWQVSTGCRLSIMAVALSLCGWGLRAAERATFILIDGSRVSGDIAFHGDARETLINRDFSLAVTPGQPERVFHADQVAVIDFVGGTPGATELDALPDNGHLLAMRGGATKRGRFVNLIGGDTVKWQDEGAAAPTRDLPIREVARIYLQPDSARNTFIYHRPVTRADAKSPPERSGRAGGMTFNVVGNDVTVEAKSAWTDAGLDVIRGDRLRFAARGEITLGLGQNLTVGPAGRPQGQSQKLPSQPLGALIGRIGTSGVPFAIGADGEVRVMPATGRLMLGVNDDVIADNSGTFLVTIRLGR